MPAQSEELQLLLASTRSPPGQKDETAIRRLLDGGIDWTSFAREAVRHGLVPLAGQGLIRTIPDLVPDEILGAFRTAIAQTAQRNRELFDELAEVVDELANGGIEAIPLRGPLLAIQAFGDLGLRPADGLDLLVRAADRTPALAVLNRLGYEPKNPGDERLHKPAAGIDVLLYTRLTPNDLTLDIDHAGLWQRAVQTQLHGRSLVAPAPEDGLIVLALHGGVRMWQRMRWACDTAGFIRSHPQLDWTAIAERARAQGCFRMVLLAASLAQSCFEAPLPDTILSEIRADTILASVMARICAGWHADTPEPPAPAGRLWLHDGLWRRLRSAALALRMPNFPAAAQPPPANPSGPVQKNIALPDAETLLATPDFFPLKMNEKDQSLSFIQMSRETYRQSPFLDRRAVPSGPNVFSAGLAQLLPAVSASRNERHAHYILHGAICGSTLLARYLEGLPHCFALKEPEFLGQLARLRIDASGPAVMEPEIWDQWFKVGTALFSRTYPADMPAVIKPTDLCNWMGDILLDHDPKTRIVFLIAPLKQFLISVLKTAQRRGWIHRRMRVLRGCIGQTPFLAETATAQLSDGQCAASIWLYNNFLCGSWLERPDGDRILPLRSTDFFANPKSTVHSVADFLGMTQAEAVGTALADFHPLSRHSKHQDVPYSAERRAKILGAAERQFGEEIEGALSWARQLAAGTRLRMPFPVE